MTQKIKIDASVVLPVYNRVDLKNMFEIVIESIVNNSVVPREIIVVLDGPIDDEFQAIVNTLEKKYALSIKKMTAQGGLTKALNFGIQNAKFDLIIRCDGDDVNEERRFERIWELYLEGYDLIGSNMREYDASGIFIAERRVPETQAKIIGFCMRRNPFNHMTAAFSKSAWCKVGGYPDVYLREDWALWCMMLANGVKARNIQENLVRVSAGDGMYQRRSGWKNVLGEWKMQKLLIRELGKSPTLALLDFCLRGVIFVSPKWLIKYIYTKYLRGVIA